MQTINPGEWIPANWCTQGGVVRALSEEIKLVMHTALSGSIKMFSSRLKGKFFLLFLIFLNWQDKASSLLGRNKKEAPLGWL